MHGTARGAACLEFGRFRLFTRQRELRLGDAPVPLGSRAFDVLLILVEAAGELVTKEELLARVWPGAVVEESNIQVQVSALRKALGEDRNLILTMPLRGYRFTGEVHALDAEARALPSAGPASGTARPVPTNLPAPVSDFIGREAELKAVDELLRHNRLVSLVGTGGIGKTRLGLEAARAMLGEFPDGVWLAELAPLTEPDLVASAINTALGLQSGAGRWTSERLAAALRGRQLLLVLDNCEHLIGAAAREAEALLRAVPGVRILATSQEPLGLDGECTYRLSPLEFPVEETAELTAALRHDAIRLFVARARAADPHFSLSERNVATVATICRRLDGIPLAIELAAARAAALGIEGLARRLDLRFHVLTGGRRTALPRHQTLRATLDWSHRLLSEPDRIVLRRLAVFAGSFSLEAASSVVADSALAEWEVIGRIAELVDKSLVVADAAGPARRYRLLETTHAYAMEKLADSGEFGSLARLHALHFRDHLRSALKVWEETPSVQWLEAQAPEIGNVRVALDWAFGSDGDRALGIELAAASYVLWYLLSLMQEGRARLERATAALGPATAKCVEAQLWYGYGFLSTGEPRGRAVPALRRAVSLFRECGEPLDLGRALSFYGLNLARSGQLPQGVAALEEARRLLSAAAHPKSLALCLTNLAIARTVAGEFEIARSLLDESLAVGAHSRADFWVWRALIYKAEVEFAEGQLEKAIAQAREVAALARAARRTGMLGHALCNLAGYLIAQGCLEEAGAALREGLPLAQESELDAVLLAGGMQHLAAIAAREKRLERAAQLIGYAHAFFSSEFAGRSPAKQQIQARIVEGLRRALPEERLAELMEAGARWTEEEAMSTALET
ncbi:MAG TPA: winged helix-turn-helix domain-containing protein [Steroidobacteraceae bacterium]|nr:winged helix-turn-helix domain-containing protein [Steroidobacteraceae bacterium]